MSLMFEAPPSAVCRIEVACDALVAACCSVVTSDEMRVEIARPAASSDAWVIFEPLDSFESELDICDELIFR
jgi:hypothetical protein